ncbi:RNA polymerase sigma factor [Bowmanella denitrificans]|uniref:RNA polymerase sigma factor n=1 Tax=Bowmanella denitrificans TaxID=366582 RepID=UPI000C9CE05C|nr:RNA polymerase sigma factor [Bowmanella denitrificans]
MQLPFRRAKAVTPGSSAPLLTCLMANQTALKAYIRRALPEEADVEDLFQKLLLKALRMDNQQGIDNPLAYGYKMAQSLIIDHLRESQRQPDELVHEPEAPSLCLDTLLDHQQRITLYKQVIATMPALRREVFIRRRLHSESRDTIARAMGLSEEAIKKHLSRAMDDLRQAMEKLDPDLSPNSQSGGHSNKSFR